MRTLFLLYLIFFNIGWSISNYNDDLERLHQQELRNQTLVNSIKIQPKQFKIKKYDKHKK